MENLPQNTENEKANIFVPLEINRELNPRVAATLDKMIRKYIYGEITEDIPHEVVTPKQIENGTGT